MSALPLSRRPLDLGLIAFFSVSVLYGFLFSLPEGLGVPVSADSPWPPLRSLHGGAVVQEPAHLRDQTRSMIVAVPIPPPVHMAIKAVFRSRRSSSSSAGWISIGPVPPIG